jgi:hypothetical protein
MRLLADHGEDDSLLQPLARRKSREGARLLLCEEEGAGGTAPWLAEGEELLRTGCCCHRRRRHEDRVVARENRGVGMENCQVQERGTSIYRHGLRLGLFSGPIGLERGLAQNPKSGCAKIFSGIKMLLRISSV